MIWLFVLLLSRHLFLSTLTGTLTASLEMPQRSLKSFYRLVVDKKGGTSVVSQNFKNVKEVGYSNIPQLLATPEVKPSKVVFTQLQGDNPWHHCPAPQFVVCLGGGWFVKTTDGKTTELRIGDVLYQDNVDSHPTAEEGTHKAMHYSGSWGDEPCDQLIVQLENIVEGEL